jgi:hypothetical protein
MNIVPSGEQGAGAGAILSRSSGIALENQTNVPR